MGNLIGKAEKARRMINADGVAATSRWMALGVRRRIARYNGRIKWWSGEVAIARYRQLFWAIHVQKNRGVFSFEIATNIVGFFGQMTWCLFLLHYCEKRGLIPDIRLTGVFVDHNRGPDWLDYYFDWLRPIASKSLAARVRYTKKISAWSELGLPVPRIDIDTGARTLVKYLRPKPHIQKLVDDFWQKLSAHGPVIGLHFRGTDKVGEAPRVSWEYCVQVMRDYLHQHTDIKAVFVASDEQEFVDFIQMSMHGIPVYCHDDHYRSKAGDIQPIFLKDTGEGSYEKGEDALVNVLLLSKCATLIRTTSFFSAWASVFNPHLKVILLNKPYDDSFWYPEREILKSRNTEYRPEPAPILTAQQPPI
jgi:hypothetical protein